MMDTLSRAFIILFMMSYSLLLIALGWSAIGPRVRRAVKNQIALSMVRAAGTYHFLAWNLKEGFTFKANTRSKSGAPSLHRG